MLDGLKVFVQDNLFVEFPEHFGPAPLAHGPRSLAGIWIMLSILSQRLVCQIDSILGLAQKSGHLVIHHLPARPMAIITQNRHAPIISYYFNGALREIGT
ncbi:hypothetical protein AKJ60_00555 [candidate division MSBL1 archaeon SCGC-AAA385M11]|nr:hypothetical protein AKJ60_00555 [candidate division MSBL1 archaeon SCGC-AAA385M11]